MAVGVREPGAARERRKARWRSPHGLDPGRSRALGKRFSMANSLAISVSSRRETGMPAHFGTPRATSSGVDAFSRRQTRGSRWRFGVGSGELALAARGSRRGESSAARFIVEPRSARPEFVAAPGRGAGELGQSLSLVPSRSTRACPTPARAARRASRSISAPRGGIVLGDADLLDLEQLDAALEPVDLGRHRGQLDRDARGGPRRSGRWLCRAGEAIGDVRCESIAAAIRAESLTRTPWDGPSAPLRPRRIAIVSSTDLAADEDRLEAELEARSVLSPMCFL